MALADKKFVTIDDLTNGEIEGLFSLADEMSQSIRDQSDLCRGKIMASLFFEPSTRTRLSFETAMHRLGGDVISAVDIGATSLAKGESIADMARVVGSYADIIVIRHPWEGAAKVVSDYAGIPVINAGDGGHEHPTQTLCDLYTLKKERNTIKGLKIALWGDLKYGRTVHSLTFALARFGATILFRPAAGLEIPAHVIRKLTREYGGELKKYAPSTTQEGVFPLNAMYMTPSSPHQLAMMPDISLQVELEAGVDAIYVTRLQSERLTPPQNGLKEYPVINKSLLKKKEFKETLVMHPLPRVDELAHELDTDPRSMYFKQAARGVPVRMALIALLLGVRQVPVSRKEEESIPKEGYPLCRHNFGLRCPNLKCVSVQDSEVKYIKPEFKIFDVHPLTLSCTYCDHEIRPDFIASAEWHEGRIESKKYHRADSHWAKKIKPEYLIVFGSENDAISNGFKPSRYARANTPKGKTKE